MFKKVLVLIGLFGMTIWGLLGFESENTNGNNPESISADSKIEIGVHEGNKAPDFLLESVEGHQVKLSEFEGKIVLLNFWASWCPPCRAEMPHMQDFYEQHDTKVEVVAVNLTSAEKNKESINGFIMEYGLTFPILLDRNGEIGRQYQAYTIPTSYFIDSNGIIVKKIIGPMDKEMMNEIVKGIK